MKHQNVIILNGKHYDALTGKMIGGSLDGVMRSPVRQPKAAVIEPARTAPQSSAKTSEKAPVHRPLPKTAHHTAMHTQAHRPEHAKTLMRHAVHKPDVAMKRAIKVQGPSDIALKPAVAVTPKRSVYQVDSRRLDIAKRTGKHMAIRHFLSYDQMPAELDMAVPQPEPLLTHSAPVMPVQPTTQVHHQPHAAHPTSKHHALFEAAIARANSHEQPHHKHVRHPKRRRLTNVMATVAAFLVIGGFITYLNMPNIELKVASFQAGFGAQIPGYKPTGFALRGGVERQGNTVSLKYQSGNQTYTLTQQASNWDSETLVENTLALNGQHKTVQAAGRTVYIYGDNNAVWVAGGVRYDLSGNAPLDADEIASLASSL